MNSRPLPTARYLAASLAALLALGGAALMLYLILRPAEMAGALATAYMPQVYWFVTPFLAHAALAFSVRRSRGRNGAATVVLLGSVAVVAVAAVLLNNEAHLDDGVPPDLIGDFIPVASLLMPPWLWISCAVLGLIALGVRRPNVEVGAPAPGPDH